MALKNYFFPADYASAVPAEVLPSCRVAGPFFLTSVLFVRMHTHTQSKKDLTNVCLFSTERDIPVLLCSSRGLRPNRSYVKSEREKKKEKKRKRVFSGVHPCMCQRSARQERSQRGHRRSASTNLRWEVEGATGAASSPAGSESRKCRR